MTLVKLFTVGLLSLVTAAQAHAVSAAQNYGPVSGYQDGYGPVYPDASNYPGRPGPVRPERPGRPGQTVTSEGRVGRIVRNEILRLRDVAHIGRQYDGYEVQRVHVHMRLSRYNTNPTLELLINRRVEDTRTVYQETVVTLHARNGRVVGDDLNSLRLGVRGEVFIERVIVEMTPAYGNGGGYEPYPDYGREVVVNLPIPGYLPPQGQIDLTRYVDVQRYRGLSLVAVELTANARNNAAVIDVLLNGFNSGTVSLNRYSSTQRVNSRQRLVLGESFGSLVLFPRGDANLTAVRLILRR